MQYKGRGREGETGTRKEGGGTGTRKEGGWEVEREGTGARK